jgi:hypothetical protein
LQPCFQYWIQEIEWLITCDSHEDGRHREVGPLESHGIANERMNSRQATALALAAWYLIGPPVVDGLPNSYVPLSRWKIEDSFDTDDDCLTHLYQLTDKAIKEINAIKSGNRKISDIQVLHAFCIATDDPRLK